MPATFPGAGGEVEVKNDTGNPVATSDAPAQSLLTAIRDRFPTTLDADGGLLVHVANPSGGGGGTGDASEASLQAILTELGSKLDEGGTVALSAATLAALETITVSNPTDVSALGTEATLAAILTELGQKLEAGQAVALDSATLAALESITVVDGGGSLTVDGTVTANAGTGPFPVSDNGGTLTVDDGGTPLQTRGQRGTLTDRSGTITTGGTSQQIAAANSSRSYLFIQNVSTGDLWVRFGAAAVTNQPSIKLASGASLVARGDGFIPTESVNVIGATLGQAFTAKEA